MPPLHDDENHDDQPGSEQEATDRAAAEAAFAGSFTGTSEDRLEPQGTPIPAEDATDGAAAPAPAPAPATAPAPAPAPADPFAGFPPEVRERLAKAERVDSLEQELRTTNGRFAAMQREMAAMRSAMPAPPPPPPPAPPPRRELVRGELPEVADMADEIEERLRAELDARLPPKTDAAAPAPPAAAPAPGQVVRSEAEVMLDKAHPDWVQKFGGADFNLWLGSQSPAFAEEVRRTTDPFVVSKALTRFDVHLDQAAAARAAAQAVQGQRSARVAAAAAPQRGNARPPPGPSVADAEAAFQQGFERAR